MPSYIVTDSATGKKLRLTGDSPPTDKELEAIFSQYHGSGVKHATSPRQKQPESVKKERKGTTRSFEEKEGLGQKVAHFLMPSHFPSKEETRQMERPEISFKDGKLAVNVPETGNVPFFEDPLFAVATAIVGGAEASGPLARRAAIAAREGLGWFTGGATEVPGLAKKGVEKAAKIAATKAEAERLAQQTLKGEKLGMPHVTTKPVKAGEASSPPSSILAAPSRISEQGVEASKVKPEIKTTKNQKVTGKIFRDGRQIAEIKASSADEVREAAENFDGYELIISGVEEKAKPEVKAARGKAAPKKGPEESSIIKGVLKDVSQNVSRVLEPIKTRPEISAGVKAAKDAMIEHHRNIRQAETTSLLLEKTVNDIVPDPERQMMMVHAFENEMKGPYWEQLNPIEQGVLKWLGQEKDKLEKFIADNNVLELLPKEKGIRHIYHYWINPETGKPFKPMYGKFSKGLPQEKQRVIPTYLIGIRDFGMTPATTNPGKLVGLELESVARASNTRILLPILHGVQGNAETSIRLSKGGTPQPIRMVERWDLLEKQGLTEGYKRYDSSFLDKPIVFKNAAGQRVIFKGAVGVKEELYPFVMAYIENPEYGKLAELNFALKSSKLGLNLFHVFTLGIQELANFRVPFSNIKRGLKFADTLTPELRLLHQEGLELYKGYEDLGGRNQFFDGGNLLTKAGNVITKPIAIIRDFTFDYVQRGMKASYSHDVFVKYLPKYLKGTGWTAEEAIKAWDKGLPMPDGIREKLYQCARETVQSADGFFSGEDWKRALLETNRFVVKAYFMPEARKRWQMALLSPTWQREHILTDWRVLKSFIPDKAIRRINAELEKKGMSDLAIKEIGPIKSQYRKYALGGLLMIASADLYNQMTTLQMDGERKHLWQNPEGKGFAVRAPWNEPGRFETDKYGHKKYVRPAPAYIRPLKSVFEVAEWVDHPLKRLGAKITPVLMASMELLVDAVKKPDSVTAGSVGKAVFDSTVPITIDQVIRYYQGKQSPQATWLPMVGMPVSKQRKEKRKKKEDKTWW